MKTLRALAAVALAALLAAFALQASLAMGPADHHHGHGMGYMGQGGQLGLLNSSTSRYLLVYPNGTVRLIVNGTVNGTPLLKGFHREFSKRYLGVHITGLEADVTGTVYSGNLVVVERATGSWTGGYEGEDDSHGPIFSGSALQSLQRSSQLNYTSNGREATILYRLSSEAATESGQEQLNLSLKALVTAVPSPEVYVINVTANASWYPALPISELSALEQLQLSGLSGINITEFEVHLTADTLNLTLNAVVNATPAPVNTTLGMVQGVINALLEPGYVKASEELTVSAQQRSFSYYRFLNVSDSKLKQLSELAGVISRLPAAPQLGGGLGGLLGNLNGGEYGQYVSQVSDIVDGLSPLINATEQIASYISSNFQLSVPTSFTLNVTLRNHTTSFTAVSPLFMAKGATEPHETLAAIDYLIGNASEILDQNGLHGLAKAVEKVYNLSITVVGKDGVLINGTSEITTTVGQLATLSVTVPQSSGSGSSAAATRTAEVGGATAAAVLTAVAVILSRRH